MSVSTPCIGICHRNRDLCVSCGRTLDEIACWTAMSETERQAVMRGLAQRLETWAKAPAAHDLAADTPS